MDLYEELRTVVDALNAAGVEYAVCGGIAVAFHGYARFTKDIDLLVADADVQQIKDVVAAAGYVIDAGAIPFDVGKPTERVVHRVSKLGEDDLVTLDVLVANEMLRPALQSRMSFEWGGTRIQVVSAEGLALMKRLAGRDQDRLDLRMLGLSVVSDRGESG